MSHLLFVGDADSVARFFFPLEAVPVFYLKLPGDCYESGSPKVEGSITRTTGCSNRKSTAPPTPTSRLQKPRKLTYTYYEAFLLGGRQLQLSQKPSLPAHFLPVRPSPDLSSRRFITRCAAPLRPSACFHPSPFLLPPPPPRRPASSGLPEGSSEDGGEPALLQTLASCTSPY